MRFHVSVWLLVMAAACALCFQAECSAMDLVRDGKAVATIVVQEPVPPAERPRRFVANDMSAGQVLRDWIKKITDVELPIADKAPEGAPAIYVGAAAVKAGLKLDDIDSPSNEGMRIVCDGEKLLLGGQNATSTVKAACRFLEELGCRFFMDHELGEVYPRMKTLTVGKLEITDKPGFICRRMWGSTWSHLNLWKIWNGAGGMSLSVGHSWAGYVPASVFKEHPEWFALRGGRRYNNQWLCTSNPQLRRFFADRVIARIKAGSINPSISPPDGRGYCQCEVCRAQDDPNLIEPRGTVSMSNRYVDFYNYVGTEVAKVYPDSILSFYSYADYTQPPTSSVKLPPNLCAWITPIRYCNFHSMGNPNCASRQQLKEVIDGWTRVVDTFAYRTYNYILSGCIVPFSKVSIWKHDIPYLKKKGCVAINMETLHCWMIYGPHIYLAIRLAYDPEADADALMEDYFAKSYGPGAGPLMKQYWMEIDRAFQMAKGGTRGDRQAVIRSVYTPDFLDELQRLMDRAAAAAKGNQTYAARVALSAEGLKNAAQYVTIHDAIEAGKFALAKDTFDELVARSESLVEARLTNHYTHLGKGEELVFRAATAPPNKVLQELPDQWRHHWDKEGAGLQKGYHKPEFDDSGWEFVPAYSVRMTNSGDMALTGDWKFRWFRTTFQVPEQHGRLSLFFSDLHLAAVVFVNGEQISPPEGRTSRTGGTSIVVDVTEAARPGDNVLAIRRPHASGRLVMKPVMLIEKR